MGTKKIREALAAMRSCIKSGESWSGQMAHVFDSAMNEVMTLEGGMLPSPTKAATTYSPWVGPLPMPPDHDPEAWAVLDERMRLVTWTMRRHGGSMSDLRALPTDAELRRYVGEVMEGGPGFAGVKK